MKNSWIFLILFMMIVPVDSFSQLLPQDELTAEQVEQIYAARDRIESERNDEEFKIVLPLILVVIGIGVGVGILVLFMRRGFSKL